MNKSEILRMENISKSFPGVRALDNVSFSLKGGTVHALMGENGAGKSTLMKCLFGVYRQNEGKIFLEGKEVEFKNSKDALIGGVAMVHQELNQAWDLSVADNMWLGRFPRIVKSLPFIDKKEMTKRTKDVLKSLGLDIDPRARIKDLPIAKRQMAEIAKAVSFGARVIVFDEPTSSLNNDEAEKLFSIIERLKSDGCGIIYISHKMEEILRICDEVTVMRDGKYIATVDASSITTDEIIRLMVGRELSKRYPEHEEYSEKKLLEVKNLSSEYSNLKNISFSLHAGEILGVCGLDGAGRTELFENLFGLSKRSTGEIFLNGKQVFNTSPKDAIRNGFALVTEERRKSGIFGILGIRENTVISSLDKFLKGILLSKSKMSEKTEEYIKILGIKTPTQDTKISTLSGGNQQKVIFARWLLCNPTVLLLDEPTRGIDVGAKYEIYSLITKLAADGRGVVLVSSEMPELLGICHRILVMSNGRLSGEVSADASQEEIMKLATKYV